MFKVCYIIYFCCMITVVLRIMQGAYFVVTSLLWFQFDVLSLIPLDLFYLKVGVVPWLRLPRYLKVSAFPLHLETIIHFLISWIKHYTITMLAKLRLRWGRKHLLSWVLQNTHINVHVLFKYSWSLCMKIFNWLLFDLHFTDSDFLGVFWALRSGSEIGSYS